MSGELSCQEIVEVVTDYLEGAMPEDERRRFEHHLSYCPGCVTYVDQIRETVRATGEVPREETLPPELRAGLLAQFRHWSRE
jgi:anti-sigma factor (TIGR02949 family)